MRLLQEVEKQETEVRKEIDGLLDQDFREALSPTPPFLLSDSVGCNYDEKRERILAEKQYTIRGCAVRARAEQSLGRWQV